MRYCAYRISQLESTKGKLIFLPRSYLHCLKLKVTEAADVILHFNLQHFSSNCDLHKFTYMKKKTTNKQDHLLTDSYNILTYHLHYQRVCIRWPLLTSNDLQYFNRNEKRSFPPLSYPSTKFEAEAGSAGLRYHASNILYDFCLCWASVHILQTSCERIRVVLSRKANLHSQCKDQILYFWEIFYKVSNFTHIHIPFTSQTFKSWRRNRNRDVDVLK